MCGVIITLCDKMADYYKYHVGQYPDLAPALQGNRSLVLIVCFWACSGSWWHNKHGYQARAWSSAKHALEPLLALKGSKISYIYKQKRYVWVCCRKAHVEWLDKNMRLAFRAEPQPLPNCRHCGAEPGAKHEQECHLAQ